MMSRRRNVMRLVITSFVLLCVFNVAVFMVTWYSRSVALTQFQEDALKTSSDTIDRVLTRAVAAAGEGKISQETLAALFTKLKDEVWTMEQVPKVSLDGTRPLHKDPDVNTSNQRLSLWREFGQEPQAGQDTLKESREQVDKIRVALEKLEREESLKNTSSKTAVNLSKGKPSIPDQIKKKAKKKSVGKPRLPEKEVHSERPQEQQTSVTQMPTKSPKRTPPQILESCSESHDKLDGRIKPNLTEISPDVVFEQNQFLRPGGSYEAEDCIPKENTAIIIPYRNRTSHLHVLLHNLLPMLYKQRIRFTIFVIEQTLPGRFNRGMLFNVGFLEASKVDDFDCFIFHDVDLIPIVGNNFYHCNDKPTHFLSGVNKFDYKLRYKQMFGGVCGLTGSQIREINGASNLYFGWGGEDDDLMLRINNKNMTMLRKYKDIGLYDMISHPSDAGNQKNVVRQKLLKLATLRQDVDGLRNTKYTQISIDQLPLYTWIKVHIDMATVLKDVPQFIKPLARAMLKQAARDSTISLETTRSRPPSTHK